MKLNVKAFALTCGLVWGLTLFFITWWIIVFEGVTCEPTLIGRVYRGYSISLAGSFIGLAWAFVDGLIIGAIFAWLYNLIAARTSSMKT
ncbi:MAG: bacteriophage holin [Candidatus Aminicenantes bacterium]|nr:bacteriophage holin [Candidatus Aminicenantes bacterium]